MSTVYNPESETIAQIERLELDAREVRRRIERSRHDEDRRVLNRQLEDIQRQIDLLRARLP
jgi:urease accessory protein UreE